MPKLAAAAALAALLWAGLAGLPTALVSDGPGPGAALADDDDDGDDDDGGDDDGDDDGGARGGSGGGDGDEGDDGGRGNAGSGDGGGDGDGGAPGGSSGGDDGDDDGGPRGGSGGGARGGSGGDDDGDDGDDGGARGGSGSDGDDRDDGDDGDDGGARGGSGSRGDDDAGDDSDGSGSGDRDDGDDGGATSGSRGGDDDAADGEPATAVAPAPSSRPAARARAERLPEIAPAPVLRDVFVRRYAPRESRGRSEFEPAELSAAGLSDAQLAALEAEGYRVITARRVGLLDASVARLAIPRSRRADAALAEARRIAPDAVIDLSHLYRPLAACDEGRCYGATLVGFAPPGGGCAPRVALGLVDTALDERHDSLRRAAVAQESFLRPGERPAPTDHGTAVASLLVGNGDTTGPLAAGARLYAAGVFAQTGTDARADAVSVIEGLDWTIERGARVVNLSLMGPHNALLERAVAAAARRGVAIVAAAGNDGPSGPPRFPAAYPSVIGVAAVDRRGRPYGGGNRGPFVDFAAPGVEVWSAGPDEGGAYWTGTSFAAPFVTAAAAWALGSGAARDAADLERALRAQALDLGETGKDPIFGWGLARFEPAC